MHESHPSAAAVGRKVGDMDRYGNTLVHKIIIDIIILCSSGMLPATDLVQLKFKNLTFTFK
jgi:hypothetical protein